MALSHLETSHRPFHREAGNVFFALFGTIVFLGSLGATISTFIKGPLTSSVQVTRASAAETQMAVIAQLVTMQASSTPQCDGDSEVEPIQWRNPAGGEPIPTGGGLVPLTLGVASTKDPWGSEFGYCVWDHGPTTCGGGRRLTGATTNTDTHTVIALVSAGPDKRFSTTCRTFAAADANTNGSLNDPGDSPLVSKTAATDDDIIYTYSYDQAVAASGGLWSLVSNDPDTATIDKNIEVGGSGIFSGGSSFSSLNVDSISSRSTDFISLADGFLLPNAASFNYACSDTLSGVLRRSASGLEICVDDNWISATGGGSGSGGGGGGGAVLEEGTADDCDNSRLGDVRYNPSTTYVEYCNGSTWITMQARSTSAALSVSPLEATNINIAGPCTTTNCPYAYGDPVHFIVTNVAAAPTGVLSVSAFSFDNGTVMLDSTQTGSCQGATLAAGGTCVIRMLPVASGNGDFYGVLSVLDGPTLRLTIPLHIVGSGFSCAVGASAYGGIVAGCLNSTTPDRVLTPPGCPISNVIEPICSGDPSEDPQMTNWLGEIFGADSARRFWGGQNVANFKGYGGLSHAMLYCDTLVLNGYDDWYLPSYNELLTYILPSVDDLRIENSSRYWTSTGTIGQEMYTYDFGGGYGYPIGGRDTMRVRCMRRDSQPAPVMEADTTPEVYINAVGRNNTMLTPVLPARYAIGASEEITSLEMIISSINTPTPIRITGPGSPLLRINGETPAASGTVNIRDIVTAVVTGPSVPGTEDLYVITIGTKHYMWRVAYPAANTRRIFVTSTTYNGNLGGLAGADTQCQTRATAAGLTGTWYALLSGSHIQAYNRVPWNWDRLENMAGEMVASNIADFIDFSTEATLDYTETGARAGTVFPWTGTRASDNGKIYITRDYSGANQICTNWTSAAAGQSGHTGNSSSMAEGILTHSSFACNTTRNLYCMGPF